MANDDRTEDYKFQLRIPVELHRKLKERADRHRRSLNQEIIIMLERDVELREVMERPETGYYGKPNTG